MIFKKINIKKILDVCGLKRCRLGKDELWTNLHIRYILIGLIAITFIFIYYNSLLNNDERFETLDKITGDIDTLPVNINENELFFAGGWDAQYNEKSKNLPARIYNIKTKKYKNLKSSMSIPRASYGMVKYGDNILILGGSCDRNSPTKGDCSHIAENYSIKNNSFEMLNNLPIPCGSGCISVYSNKRHKIYLITYSGIMSFDISKRTFEKLAEFDYIFDIGFGTVIDGDFIYIWGHSIKFAGIFDRTTFDRILKYDIKENKITEQLSYKDIPSRKTPISSPGVILNQNKILFLKGNENGGTVYIYDFVKNKMENNGKTELGTYDCYGVYLGNNKVLLAGGNIIPSLGLGDSGIHLEHAILDLKTNKLSNIKTKKTNRYKSYIIPMSEHKVFIGKYDYGNAEVYNY